MVPKSGSSADRMLKAKHAFDLGGGDLAVRRVSWDGREVPRGEGDSKRSSRYFQLEEREAVVQPPRQFQAATKELAAEWVEHLEKAAGMRSSDLYNNHHLRLTLSPPYCQTARHGEDTLIFGLKIPRYGIEAPTNNFNPVGLLFWSQIIDL